MGLGKSFICSDCGNTFEIYEGIGMLWHSFDISMFYPPEKNSHSLNFYNEIDKKMLKEIQKFIEESEDVFVADAYCQPYICKNCGKYENKLYFKIVSKDKTYRPKYFCNCGNRYKRLTKEDQAHLYCEKCGGKMLNRGEICWD